MEQSTVNGVVERIIFHNDSNAYTILELETEDQLLVAVGIMPMVSVGERLRLTGKWVSHPTFGEQLQVESFEQAAPNTAEGILRYLSSRVIKGVGRALALRMVERFGDKTLEVLEREPERLQEVKGITAAKALRMQQQYLQMYGLRELMLYLKPYNISADICIKAWRAFGASAMQEIRHDPFCLCTEGIDLPFPKADAIAREMEYDKENSARLESGIVYVLRHNQLNGHTCLPEDKLLLACKKLLSVELEPLKNALETLVERQQLLRQTMPLQRGEVPFYFLPKLHKAEAFAATRLSMLQQFPPQSMVGVEQVIADMEAKLHITYASKQKEAITTALEQGILLLTGKPGTGKTTTLNAMISILEEQGERVLLAAPTGRAAKRMSEVTGREAKTIHRLLQVEWTEGEDPIFAHNEKHLLECDALVLDEVSMVDVFLFESVLRALPLGCRFILVGDSHQLPSVGPGNVLGDLIRSGTLPVVELDEIFRQAMESLIITNAHRIIQGEMPRLDIKDQDFFFLPRYAEQTVQQTLVELCTKRLPKTYGYTLWQDIQVLSPTRKGPLGTMQLNQLLQEAINPKEPQKKEMQVGNTLFRQGDKVMQIKNNYNLVWTKTDGTEGEGVFNGDIGILLDIDHKLGIFTVQMEERLVVYEKEQMGELELAYAMTVHKSQGNEFSAVLLPMYPGPPQLYYRNLLYTGITRAKSLLILVGREETIAKMVENDKKTKRYTGLSYFMQEASQ